MVITLTGFMGCGKSSVGEELARLLSFRFCDLDAYIVHKAGKDIPAIFAENPERFRALEAEAVRDNIIMSEIEGFDLVLALGGGALMNPEVEKLVLGHSRCVYLETSLEALQERLEGCCDRPLLGTKSIADLFEERRPGYEKAGLKVGTDGRTPGQVAQDIFRLLA